MFLIQRNRHALLGRAMDRQDMKRVLDFLSVDPVTSILLEDNVDNVSHALFSKPCATLILILFL